MEKYYNIEDNYIDKEYQNIIKLWMARSLLEFGIVKNNQQLNNLDRDIEIFFQLNRFECNKNSASNKLDTHKVTKFFEDELKQLEEKHPKLPSALQNNLNMISKLLSLSKNEELILAFIVLAKHYSIFDDILDTLGDITINKLPLVLSKILNIDYKEVQDLIFYHSNLFKSKIIYLNISQSNYRGKFNDAIQLIDDSFTSQMMIPQSDTMNIFNTILKRPSKSALTIKDYCYMKQDIQEVSTYLKESILHHVKGVNILLYGMPGTGKTEISKIIAQSIETTLFELSYLDNDGEMKANNQRLNAYHLSQNIIQSSDTIILFDEIEDIFPIIKSSGHVSISKAYINDLLENNAVPTIWISNDISAMDNAYIRRFDLCIEMKTPPKKYRKRIIEKYSNNRIDKKTIKQLAGNPFVVPGIIERAIKVTHESKTEKIDFSKKVKKIVNNTLKAQYFPTIKKTKQKTINKYVLPKHYDSSLIACNSNLEKITEGIKKNNQARLCLYGPAGTGKSAYGQYLGKMLKKNVLIKKGSDLLSMYVGGTEKNIANAFNEAKKTKAILLFDEVDTFLQDRRNTTKTWEISQINEMLVQMEKFNGVFIATTNFIENLDQASMRRFDAKLNFSYLKNHQSISLLEKELKSLSITFTSNELELIQKLSYLTPGDFAMISRQHRFNPISDVNDYIDRLIAEVSHKTDTNINTQKMGFLVA